MMDDSTAFDRSLRTRVHDDTDQSFGALTILIIMVAFAVCVCFSSWYVSRKKAMEEAKANDENDEKRNVIRSTLEAKNVVMVGGMS